MGKKEILLSLGLAVITIGGITFATLGDRSEERAQDKAVHQDRAKDTVTKEELHKAAEAVGTVKNEDELVEKMTTMSIQKVKLNEDENYHIAGTIIQKRIQLNQANVAYLKEKADEINADSSLNQILIKWSEGDFATVNEDYINIRKVLSGSANGPNASIRSEQSERDYVEHFFGA